MPLAPQEPAHGSRADEIGLPGDDGDVVAPRQVGAQLAQQLPRRFDVRASRGTVLLELRSPRIPAGDIEIRLDLDHAMVKLLVPDGATLDHDDVRRVGRCGYVDWSGTPAPGGR